MQALLNQVILKSFEIEGVTSGGIILPDSIKRRSSKAEIISVGKGTKKRPMIWEKGQIVHHVKNHGTEVIDNGEKVYLMDMDAIIAYY
ncbi:MAG: co-chaperone GroES [Bacteroidetes bacterium]|nr:co-chaperone GroES [Bacteroidota bacterium]